MAGGAVVDGGEVDATDLANRAPLQWVYHVAMEIEILQRDSALFARDTVLTARCVSRSGAVGGARCWGGGTVGQRRRSPKRCVLPHPNRFEECLALLVGKIAETVQSGPDRCDHHMRCPY
jgi:hypothetical protein